jgi:hypothetical protein
LTNVNAETDLVHDFKSMQNAYYILHEAANVPQLLVLPNASPGNIIQDRVRKKVIEKLKVQGTTC